MEKYESDAERLAEIEAREKLIERGYKRKECRTCNGIGFLSGMYACLKCDGRGWVWKAPLEF